MPIRNENRRALKVNSVAILKATFFVRCASVVIKKEDEPSDIIMVLWVKNPKHSLP